jgi:hypothetical protein
MNELSLDRLVQSMLWKHDSESIEWTPREAYIALR